LLQSTADVCIIKGTIHTETVGLTAVLLAVLPAVLYICQLFAAKSLGFIE